MIVRNLIEEPKSPLDEPADPSLNEEEVWKAHILKSRASRLSDVKYCQKHELSVWRFTTFKKKLGLTKPKAVGCSPQLNAFAKVVPAESEFAVRVIPPERIFLMRGGWPSS